MYNVLKRSFIDNTGIMDEDRAKKTDFYKELNSG